MKNVIACDEYIQYQLCGILFALPYSVEIYSKQYKPNIGSVISKVIL